MPAKAAITLLPKHDQRPPVDGKSRNSSIAQSHGFLGMRKGVERWRDSLRPDYSKTVTTIRHDPESAPAAARRASFQSSISSSGIVRRDSVHVLYDDDVSWMGREHRCDELELDNRRVRDV